MAIRLNIGCWRKLLSGYMNIDTISAKEVYEWKETPLGMKYMQANICNLPYVDNSVEFILTESTLEHLYFEEAYEAIWECHRILEIGGKFQVSVPNFEYWVTHFPQVKKSYLDRSDMEYAILCPIRANNMSPHRSLWWDENLVDLLTRVGFKIDDPPDKNSKFLNCVASK